MAGLSVAVIGLGAAGLAALKNLKEEGYDVTGFDKNSYIGGLWRFADSEQTSVLETTIVNVSKERGCFTDFPFPDSVPSYPTAAQLYQYLVDYADHFDLHPHCRLNTPIEIITFDDKLQRWVVNIKNQQPLHFDKVVIATGGRATSPIMPVIPGLEQFTGTSMHAQKFKRPQPFAGKKVVVVGFGNSAADTATQLAGVAAKVYLAHRRGAAILPRYVNNRPADHTLSLRLFTIQSLCLRLFPIWGGQTFKGLLKKLQDKSWNLRPEWRFEPASSLPILSDTLVPCLAAGTVTSTHGVKRIAGPRSVELDDGTVLHDIDAIVWCTGYQPDFSLVDARFDPTTNAVRPSVAWDSIPSLTGKPMFNLYLNVFSLEKPDSLAFLGNVVFPIGAFQVMDCATMAIAQVWKTPSDPSADPRLPSREAMEKQVLERFEWMRLQARCGHDWNVTPYSVDAAKWTQAMDHLGATGVNEYLGYGWRGWWFWVTDMRFCNLLMGGIWSPHVYRVFEGGRKRWEGAREAVEHVNRTVRNFDKKRV